MISQIMEKPGFVKELNEEMLQLYLSLTYVAGENTFFKGVKKLFAWKIFNLAERKNENREILETRIPSG